MKQQLVMQDMREKKYKLRAKFNKQYSNISLTRFYYSLKSSYTKH